MCASVTVVAIDKKMENAVLCVSTCRLFFDTITQNLLRKKCFRTQILLLLA